MKIAEAVVFQLSLPLSTPYRVSFRTYTAFEPLFVKLTSVDGAVGWGEVYIPPGSTFETPATGWAFCNEQSESLVGANIADARDRIEQLIPTAPFACTALLTALAVMERDPLLNVDVLRRIPLVAPVRSADGSAIPDEIEQLLETGYRTLKVKVGWDVENDLRRVALVQQALAGRADITMDANRGFIPGDAIKFATSLDPAGITLFEQPCGADDWEAAASVAAVSRVPIMLDESIRGIEDVDRAAEIRGVKLVKLKLKRLGGLHRTVATMQHALGLGLDVCLGDGVATELVCWAEACIGRNYVKRAGDMNGFLKPQVRLFREPLEFDRGSLVLKPGFWPEVDEAKLQRQTVRQRRYAKVTLGRSGVSACA